MVEYEHLALSINKVRRGGTGNLGQFEYLGPGLSKSAGDKVFSPSSRLDPPPLLFEHLFQSTILRLFSSILACWLLAFYKRVYPLSFRSGRCILGIHPSGLFFPWLLALIRSPSQT